MARGVAHSPEVKAAVMAALLTGAGVDTVASEYQLPRGTVRRWKQQIDQQSDQLVEPQKRAELGDLIVEYARENLTTLAAQSRYFRTPEWLEKQSASEVAVLHGVIADKTFRILSALEPANTDGDPES